MERPIQLMSLKVSTSEMILQLPSVTRHSIMSDSPRYSTIDNDGEIGIAIYDTTYYLPYKLYKNLIWIGENEAVFVDLDQWNYRFSA